LLLFSKKEESSFSEEKEAKRLLFLVHFTSRGHFDNGYDFGLRETDYRQ
jgi:hypothetical protein